MYKYRENTSILLKNMDCTLYLKQYSFDNRPMIYKFYMKFKSSGIWEFGPYTSFEMFHNSLAEEGRHELMTEVNIKYIETTFILTKEDKLFISHLNG